MKNEHMQNHQKPLSPAEKKALRECEKTFQQGLGASFEAGRALQQIRDGELYREAFATFAPYCVEKWDCSRSRADRLIAAWRVYQLLTPIGVKLGHEFQARPLISLTDEQIVAAGKLVLQIAGAKKLTSEHFRLAAAQVKPPALKPSPPQRAAQSPDKAAEEALTFISRAEEAAQHGHKAAMLDALAALRGCVLRMATKNESNPGPAHQDKTGDLPVAIGSEAITQPTVDPPISTNPDVLVTQIAPKDPNSTNLKPAIHQPVAVLLGGRSSVPITRWYKVPLCVANCLLERGSSLSSLAFVKRKTSAFPASARLKTLRDGSFIELGDDRASLLRKTRRMLNQCGRGDMTVAVRLSGGETIDL